jgi:hypothetical protein
VVITADHDPNGAGADAADDLAQRLRRRGVHVDVLMPKSRSEKFTWFDKAFEASAGWTPGGGTPSRSG